MPRTAMPPEADTREGAEDAPRGRKGKPMTDTEGSCKDCEGDCAKCAGKKKNKKKSMFAPGFKEDAAPVGLKCGKSAISKGEKCHKGPATPTPARKVKSSGPSAPVQVGQGLKRVGLGALEAVKWTSGYNIGKAITTGATRGKNEKGSLGSKVGATLAAGFVFGPQAALGAARRAGAFGPTDLQQHAMNERKEKKWRRSVGYKDSTPYADGFKLNHADLAI